MDNSVMGGRLLSGSAGILELETLHRNHQHPLAHQQLAHHHHMQSISIPMNHHPVSGLESNQSLGLLELKSTSKSSINCGKGKGPTANSSDEDEPSFTEDGNDSRLSRVRGKKGSPWQRMKWTDNMVRLLITVVSCVGEDGTPESADGSKRKPGILQKKGKWKTVSKVMMDRGCYVSPQQCEDKFNDLNKRYKRLNEILGRGTTCRVVENPAVLDSMTHLSVKVKDDVRKILSSKHLFYKEICAYHNGQRLPNPHDFDLQPCGQILSSYKGRDEHGGYGLVRGDNRFNEDYEEDNEDCDEEMDNDDDNDGDGEDERVVDFGKRKKLDEEEGCFWSQSVAQDCGKLSVRDSFGAEMAGMMQDTSKSLWEQREWVRNRMLLIHEQRVHFHAQSFELEKRRFKWQKFCNKKDRELEKLRLENERMRLENERMALQVKQKELEIDFKRPEALMNPMAALGMDRLQGRDHIEMGQG